MSIGGPKPRALAVICIAIVIAVMIAAGCAVSATMGGQVVGALIAVFAVSRVVKRALSAANVRPDAAGAFAGIGTWLAALALVDASGFVPIEEGALLYGTAALVWIAWDVHLARASTTQ